jgi:hypothetical protein
MKAPKIFLALATLVLSLLPQFAVANTSSECKIPSGQWSIVSLGFPLKTERLANIKSPKILVLHYIFKGEPVVALTQEERTSFLSVTQDLRDFSSNQNTPEISFSKPIEIPYTASDLDQVKINVRDTFGKDFSNSTYGFVEKIVQFSDSVIDYKGIDAVLLYGKSAKGTQEIAEAMMFTADSMRTNNAKRADGANWFDPIKTNEGLISNFSLLYNNSARDVFTHEVMHLYGLTDLYGGDSGPGALSLMESNRLNLLTYEKWILGWHPEDKVKCLNKISDSVLSEFTLEFQNFSEIMVIRTTSGNDYVVETLINRGKPRLAFYSVDNEARPPLKFFKDAQSRLASEFQIETPDKIGAMLVSPELSLLVSDISSGKVTLNLIGKSELSSQKAKDLASAASKNKVYRLSEYAEKEKLIEEARVAAELKAKQEAEAKAAADLKAKLEAEKATALKKSTITCIKGKLTQKVTAAKPTCPSGYKLKK